MANEDAKQERNAYMSDSIEFRPGDRAVTRIGRNLVEVRVKAKTVGGYGQRIKKRSFPFGVP